MILTLFISLMGCTERETEIFGKYESVKKNSIQKSVDYFSNKHYLVDISLSIKKDSSFLFENCSMKIEGYWKLKSDSLFLYCKEKKFIIDSLNSDEKYKLYLKSDSLPLVYLKKDNHLVKESLNNNSIYFQDLKKVN
jgi:hypothetical protein